VLNLTSPDESPRLALPDTELHVWLSDYQNEVSAVAMQACSAVLTNEERAQQARFLFAKDRQRYLITRALVRTVLSRYADVGPSDWQFTKNKYGKPQIADSHRIEPSIHFNLSHTHSLIVLAVARQQALGVDVENWTARPATLDLARRFFAPGEALELASVPSQDQQYRFFEYWTFKESYIKARGMGLSLSLDRFRFGFPDHCSVVLSVDSDLNDESMNWHLWQLRPSHEYLIALCGRRAGSSPPSLVIRNVQPFASEESVITPEVRIVRTDRAAHERWD
jgi:4'-phosphopantetheinyl transferase